MNVWEYLVSDFLETACLLNGEEQDFLVERLRDEEVAADSIEVHSGFSIDGRAVLVVEGTPIEQCWLYDPKEKKLTKTTLVR